MLSYIWILAVAACLVYPQGARSSSDVIESSMSANDFQPSLRFFGITKTMATTTTVLTTQTVYVYPTCLLAIADVKPCAQRPTTTTPIPTTTTTTTPRPTTTTKPTTPTTTTTSKPWIQIIPGSVRPLLTGSVTINKVDPPKLQVNLPDLLGGGSNGGQGNNIGNAVGALINKRPVNVNVGGSVSASISTGSKRRRRSQVIEENIQPSVVRAMEMTASPELSLREAIQQDVQVETSRADDFEEYEIVGLTSDHFNMNGRAAALPFMNNRVTIIKMDKVTITQATTVTSSYPSTNPKDRVTLAYYGCIPDDAPSNLPNC